MKAWVNYEFEFARMFSGIKIILIDSNCVENSIRPFIQLQLSIDSTFGCPMACLTINLSRTLSTPFIALELDTETRQFGILCGKNLVIHLIRKKKALSCLHWDAQRMTKF